MHWDINNPSKIFVVGEIISRSFFKTRFSYKNLKIIHKPRKISEHSNQCLNMFVENFTLQKYDIHPAWMIHALMLNAFMLWIYDMNWCLLCLFFLLSKVLKNTFQRYLECFRNFYILGHLSNSLDLIKYIFLKLLNISSWALNILFRFFVSQYISRYFLKLF